MYYFLEGGHTEWGDEAKDQENACNQKWRNYFKKVVLVSEVIYYTPPSL